MGLFDGLIGSVVGGLFGMAGADKQAASAKEQTILQAKLQRENWEYAQKNAHQFEIEDLRNAGLNPILSATHSQLASMPSVAGSSGAPYGQLGSIMAHAVTSGLQLRNDNERVKLEQAKVDLDKSRLELEQQQSAKHIEFYDKQIDKLDNDISIASQDLELRKALTSEDLNVKRQAAYELATRANENIAHSDLQAAEKHKLQQQMKYGFLIASYLPEEAREFAYSNMVTWLNDHQDEIKEFVSNYDSGDKWSRDNARRLAFKVLGLDYDPVRDKVK